MNVCIVGAGSWGIALGMLLFDNGHNIKIWSRNENEIQEILTNHEIKRYLPEIRIPSEIGFTSDINKAIENSDIVILAVPSTAIRGCSKMISGLLENQIIVSVAKGIENDTLKRLSEVIREELPSKQKIAVLSGPSHAEEVARKLPTVVALSSDDKDVRDTISSVFMNEYFRVYPNSDLLGVEVGGAVKNVIALCAGISDGLGFGDNAKAGLITRGLAEIIRLGVKMGGKPETFYGLTGIGDLVVTCASKHSRNHKAGEYLGQGYSLEDTLSKVNMVVEGVNAAKAIRKLGIKYGVELPIVEQANLVLFEGKNPRVAVTELMGRDKKNEI